ncbi:MAG: FecR family protein [Odoribacter splanchnicus]|jgi:putative anti-sigma factor
MKTNEEITSDIEYILEHLGHSEKLTEPEFRKWLSDPEHLQLFESVRLQSEAFLRKELKLKMEIGQEWDAFRRQLLPPRRLWIGWCSAAACVFLIFLGILRLTVDHSQPEVAVADHVPVAKRSAELILADGSSVALANEEVVIREQAGTSIRHDTEHRLVYVADGEPADSLFAYNTLKVPAGADYFVQLEDGSRVWVNCESELKYPIRFSKKERRVILQGEAYFEVNKASEWPFVVETEDREVVVTGTSFNVKAYPRERMWQATLITGRVEIPEQNGKQVLRPSQQYSLDKSTKKAEIRKVDTDVFTGWKDGVFVFRNSRLEDVLANLARWYRVEIFYAREAVKDICFSGNLDRYEDIDHLLQVINGNGQVVLTRNKEVVIVN